MMEPPTYRLELEQILSHFGGKRILSRRSVAEFLGKSPEYCRDHLKIGSEGVTAVQLALILSKI